MDYIETQFTYTTTFPQEKTMRLVIPKDWEMFTSGGNRSLRLKAEKLVEKVSKETDTLKRLKHFANFWKSYRTMSSSKTMAEADDTAVREIVWDFSRRVGKCFGIDEHTLNTLWESRESYPKRGY